ncbi:MAG: 4Fe-4S binding protein, partial [Desulfovibrio sp.]
PRRLRIPGEDLAKCRTSLSDPDDFTDQDVVVVGAGDVAAEIALALAERNRVSLLVRRDKIDRPKQRNRDALHALAAKGKIKIHYNTSPKAVTEQEVAITCKGEESTLKNDVVFCALGSDLPLPLLRKLGIRMESDWTLGRMARLVGFLAVVLFYYLWKKEFLKGFVFPESWGFWTGDSLGLYGWTRTVSEWASGVLPAGPSLWAGAVYSALVLVFGLGCLRKYRGDPFQRKRYIVVIISQVLLLWIIPEIVFQGILALADGWRSYGLVIPAPLYVWNFKDPMSANLFWLVWFTVFSFIGVPLYSKFTGKMYCSWVCGCGCLAETFGDRWRHLAPRGRRARAWENFGQWTILGVVACFVALGLANAESTAWTWQELLVDFLLAGVIGVAAYPFWGNRIWCRFLCPLSRVMHAVAGNTSQRKISSGAHCIECGLCSKYCQMGIPVMEFAKNAQPFDNANSSCIQCGICVSVCPVRNLQHMEWDEDVWKDTVRNGPMVPLK